MPDTARSTAVQDPEGLDRTVSTVAREAGVAGSAVRFYEANGLVTARRTPGGQRRFTTDAACRIKVAKVAQRVGLSLREITSAFETLPDEASPEDWQRVTAFLVAEARARVQALEAQIDELDSDRRLCDLG